MNFLAHILLSGKDEEIIIGNFIADSVKGKKHLHYPDGIRKGIILHRAIDFFTDTHPTVRKSKARLFKRYGHYNGVIVDILYDHFLAANWGNYSSVPLEEYTRDFYRILQDHFDLLPKPVQQFLPFMVKDNWLLSYATTEGIRGILLQMDQRTGKKSRMDLAVAELEEYYLEFKAEFTSFFGELLIFSEKKIKSISDAF